MGLDMYAHTITVRPSKDVDFEELDTAQELHYWRKHPNLHGWMKLLYKRKGGTSKDFNCVPVVLGKEDIDELEKAVLANRLPFTEGFFFGESDASDKIEDIAFIAKARAAIAEGKTVFYTSWW